MKKILLPICAMLLCMTACKKEKSDFITLEVEQYNSDAKVHLGVSGNHGYVYWDNFDTVYMNGTPLFVSTYDKVQIIDVPETGDLYAGYPKNVIENNSIFEMENPLPAIRHYRENNGNQLLDAPMVAYAASDATTMKFHNLCAVMGVNVVNSTGCDMFVDTLAVTSSSSYIGTSENLTIQNMTSDHPSFASPSNGVTTVKIVCKGAPVRAGQSKVFYIPLLPVSNTQFTVKVYADGNIYQHTSNGGQTFAQNNIYEVPFDCSTSTGTYDVKYLFTINTDGSRASFTSGNLQYVNGTWKIADNPWDIIGADNTSTNCDLFGWSSDGEFGRSIYATYNGYDGTFNDWGNTLGENNGYRTLTINEWDKVFSQRNNSVIFNGAANTNLLWVRATVNGVAGVILFPDGNVSLHVLGKSLTENVENFTINTYTADEWSNIFEAAGCVFLPAAGISSRLVGECGYYWSSSKERDDNAYAISFSNSSNPRYMRYYYSDGLSVRLVKDE